jgi:hypothetical protein
MNADSLPGDLGSDLLVLQTRMQILMDANIKLGEQKARVELMQVIAELIAEKDRAEDELAINVLNWLWVELAERYPVE